MKNSLEAPHVLFWSFMVVFLFSVMVLIATGYFIFSKLKLAIFEAYRDLGSWVNIRPRFS